MGIPIILVATYVDGSHRQASACGLSCVFVKPFYVDDLVHTVKGLIGAVGGE